MKLTPEQRFLVLCSRQRLDTNRKRMLEKLLGTEIDYEALQRAALAQYVLPFIYHHLNCEGLAEKVPAKFLESAKKNFYTNTLRNIQIFKELEGLIVRLKSAGIPIVLLKGGYLANVVYENAALRPFHDIDILIRKENFPVIKEVLSENRSCVSVRPASKEIV